MRSIDQRMVNTDWDSATTALNDTGYALLPSLVDKKECRHLIDSYTVPELYRKTVTMERYRFGRGEYKYFNYPLPNLVQNIRTSLYPHLAMVANSWMAALSIDVQYPLTHNALLEQCKAASQSKATPLILKYGKGGYNTLHQDLYGEVYFPMQAVLFLNSPGEDYTGGEFVLIQQTPRAQSKAIVLQPKEGDLLIFTTNFRPVKGSRGYYRAPMKHGVSEVHSGTRQTLGIIFHDAES